MQCLSTTNHKDVGGSILWRTIASTHTMVHCWLYQSW